MIDTLFLRPSLHFAPLHYTCRHFSSSHSNFTQLHFTTFSFGLTPFQFPTAPFHLTSLHFNSLHFTALLGDFRHNSLPFISWLTLCPPSPTSPQTRCCLEGEGSTCHVCRVFTVWAIPDLVYTVELKVTQKTSQVIHNILRVEVILAVTVRIIASCDVTCRDVYCERIIGRMLKNKN